MNNSTPLTDLLTNHTISVSYHTKCLKNFEKLFYEPHVMVRFLTYSFLTRKHINI